MKKLITGVEFDEMDPNGRIWTVQNEKDLIKGFTLEGEVTIFGNRKPERERQYCKKHKDQRKPEVI